MARPTDKGLVSRAKLTAIADEIRRIFSAGTGTYTLDAIKTRLAGIVLRGVGDISVDRTASPPKVHIPAGYYSADVEFTVPGANLGYQQFNANGTYFASNFGLDGWSKVDIDVW